MNLDSYKDFLHPHQFEGLVNFVAWWKSLNRFCHLSGCAGSGKTYSLKYYIEAIGLRNNQIALAAPTNAAAAKLSESFGGDIEAMSIHRLYKIAPIKNSWTQNDQSELDRLQEILDKDDTMPIQERENLEQQFLQLKRKAGAFAKNELFFAPDDSFSFSKSLRLIIVDEGSMVDDSMYEWIHLYTSPTIKVIFLCDKEQIYPVKKSSLSKVFESEKIADFSLSVRSQKGTSLHDLIEKIRHVDFKTQVALLKNLEELEDVENIQEGTASIVSGVRDTKKLIQSYAKKFKPDGLEWRILAYKNNTVEEYNRKAKFSTGTGFLSVGDDLVVQNAITRGGFSDSWEGCKYFSVVDTSTMITCESIKTIFQLNSAFKNFKSIDFIEFEYSADYYGYIVEKAGLHDISCLRLPANEIFNISRWIAYLNDSKIKLFKQSLGRDYIYNAVIPHPDSADEYYALADYFSKLSLSFYRATKSPETSENIREFMSWLGEQMGINLSTPKPLREWFRNQSRFNRDSNLVVVKNLVQKIGNAINNLVDDVRYPFASTLHKSQGQTINHVIIDLNDVESIRSFSDEEAMKRLLYTGVSRAAKTLIVFV